MVAEQEEMRSQTQAPQPQPSTSRADVNGAAGTHVRRRKAAPGAKPKPPAKVWPPPQKDTLHALYSVLQSALGEDVEPPPEQRACDTVKAMKNVGSRWKDQQQPASQQPQPRQQQQRPGSGASPRLSPSQPPPLPLQQLRLPSAKSVPAGSPVVSAKAKAKAALEAEVIQHCPPIPLANRAVHPVLLRELLKRGIPAPGHMAGAARSSHSFEGSGASASQQQLGPEASSAFAAAPGPVDGPGGSQTVGVAAAAGGGRWQGAGWATTEQLIARCIKPATAAAHTSLVQAIVGGAVALPWCPEGRFHGPDFEAEHLQGRPAYGPATFFVSFSYGYRLEELVAAILRHYAGLPEVSSGAHAPVYYWLAPFAVNANHGPDIRKNPESNFEVVVQRCRALLLACKPWSAPTALTRTWCLYECMVAINANVDLVALNLELDLPLDTIFDGGGIEKASDAFSDALAELDIRRTHCSSKMDFAYLMSQVDRHLGGPDQCNIVLALGLRPCLMSALLTLVLKRPRKDYALATQLVEAGEATLQWGPAFVAGRVQGGDPAAAFFGVALRNPEVSLAEVVLDLRVAPLNASGSQGLTLTRPGGLLLGQEGAGGGASGALLRSGTAADRRRPSGGGGGGAAPPPALGLSSSSGAPPGSSRASTAVTAGMPRPHGGGGSPLRPPITPVLLLPVTAPATPLLNGGFTARSCTSNAGSMAAGHSGHHERPSWTSPGGARRGGGGGAGASVLFCSQALQPEHLDWSLGGWSSSSVPEHDTVFGAAAAAASSASAPPHAAPVGRAIEGPGNNGRVSGPASIATTPRDGANTGGGAASVSGVGVDARNAQLPKSKIQLRQEEQARARMEPDRLVGPEGAAALAAALASNPNGQLVTLDLNNNALGSAGVVALVAALHFNCSLKTLLLRNNGLDAECGPALGQALGRNTTLTCLDLGGNPLGPSPMIPLAAGLPSSGLRDLQMDSVGMETDGVCSLAKGLAACSSLLRLDLSSNGIDSAGACALSLSLRTCSLQCLLLGHNRLGSAGVSALADALTESGGRALKMLVLRNNELGLESGAGLAELLAASPPLACLDVSHNPLMGSIGVAALARGLRENHALCELRLSSVRMDADGAAALAEAMGKGAKALLRLDLSDNAITSAGAEALAVRALSSPDACRLHELRLERCGLTAAGRLALVSSMQANPACVLRHLHMAGNVDPDANPKAGARLAAPAGAGGITVVGMSKAEQLLAQALNIGRQLANTRNLRIYE